MTYWLAVAFQWLVWFWIGWMVRDLVLDRRELRRLDAQDRGRVSRKLRRVRDQAEKKRVKLEVDAWHGELLAGANDDLPRPDYTEYDSRGTREVWPKNWPYDTDRRGPG